MRAERFGCVLATVVGFAGCSFNCSPQRPAAATESEPAALPDEPNHRLAEGRNLLIVVDAGRKLRPVNRRVLGLSFLWDRNDYAGFFDMASKAWALDRESTQALADLRIPFTRFYGLDDDPWSVSESIDKVAHIAERLGGIPQENIVLELETAAERNKTFLAPSVWQDAVRYAQGAGYRFKHWEIGNEVGIDPSLSWRQYSDHVKAVSAAIKAAQPEALVGLSVDAAGLDQNGGGGWTEGVIRSAAGAYDFVCPHLYLHMGGWTKTRGVDARPLEEVSLHGNFTTLRRALRLRKLLQKHNPGRDVKIIDTEWGLHGYTAAETRADRVVRNGNIVGTLHRAIRMIYYVREGLVDAAGQWSGLTGLHSDGLPDPGFLAVPMFDSGRRKGVHYYTNLHFGRTVADDVLDVSGTCPYHRHGDLAGPKVAVLATASLDRRRLALILANGTASEDLPALVRLKGFTAGTATGHQLTQATLDDPALVTERDVVSPFLGVTIAAGGTELQLVAPARSILFLSVTAAEL